MKKLTDKRALGAVIPVGALRTKNSTGIGEFPDLIPFALLCKKMKISLIQILPVNDTGYESSPYNSLTAFALNPIYLRIDDLDEAAGADRVTIKRLKAAKDKFKNEERFPYIQVLKEKMEICRMIFNAKETEILKSAEDGKLAQWIKQNPWVKVYAVYRRLKEENEGKSWKQWNEYRDVSPDDIESLWNKDDLRCEHLFWVWLQEALDTQFTKASKAITEAGIILEGDLPILMNDDSADVWAHPEIFNQDLSAGAPPDMYSPEGQNWGFPVYNWDAQEKDNYAWWRSRLAAAGKYYHAYRIDHVLGFFRIWASSRDDLSSALGRYVPFTAITGGDLKKLGFDKSRIRWLSMPHISTNELLNALRESWGGLFSDAEVQSAAGKIFSQALDRINNEELWLFKKNIKGEIDIQNLGLHPAIQKYLLKEWRNRVFYEYEKGKYSPTWFYKDSRAYGSLSSEEKNNLEDLLLKRRGKSEKIWEAQGKKLLSVLVESSAMLPCAEDLGAVPACVPKVLSKLKILGLRVVRWHREWSKPGQPYIPFEDYPALSVCTPAVHDSSTVRQWWEKEADQNQFSGFIGVPSLPKVYNPGTAKVILSKIAAARSRYRVFQIQDLLHLSNKWYAEDPASERINVPGTYNEFNWTYRLPAVIAEIAKDKELIASVRELSKIKAAKKR